MATALALERMPAIMRLCLETDDLFAIPPKREFKRFIRPC